MKLPNKYYDVLKWVIMIFVPALITLISGLGVVFDYDTATITTVIGLFATFVGSIIGISTANYYADEEIVEIHEEDTGDAEG